MNKDQCEISSESLRTSSAVTGSLDTLKIEDEMSIPSTIPQKTNQLDVVNDSMEISNPSATTCPAQDKADLENVSLTQSNQDLNSLENNSDNNQLTKDLTIQSNDFSSKEVFDQTSVDNKLTSSDPSLDKPKISSYFSSPINNEEKNNFDVFDSIATQNNYVSPQRSEENNVHQNSVQPSSLNPDPSNTGLSQHNLPTNLLEKSNDCVNKLEEKPDNTIHSPDQPTSIDFVEDIGTGLPNTISTNNIKSFFESTNDSAVQDIFDSFTSVAQNESIPTVSNNPENNSLKNTTAVSDAQLPALLNSGALSGSLLQSDSDTRHCDAWIPSELTRQMLLNMVTMASDATPPEPEQLTMPKLIVEQCKLQNPIYDLIHRFMGEQEAIKRTNQQSNVTVTQDESGLCQLIESENYRAALDLIGHLITLHERTAPAHQNSSRKVHTPKFLQLWYTRIALLVKMRLYSQAESECSAFGNLDRPDLYYEFYPQHFPGKKGSMVPFSFRILYAELPQHLGKSLDSLDRLYYVQGITSKILSNLSEGLAEDGSELQLSEQSRKQSVKLWKSREVMLLYSIGNCLLHLKDYSTAVDIFESLITKDSQKSQSLLLGIGRIFLQIGDAKQAKCYFDKFEEQLDLSSSENMSMCLMNKGFLALVSNNFNDAYQHLKQAIQVNPKNAVAVNNLAVCALYVGKLKEALSLLERLIHEDPALYLQESILFNLCTLYELESTRAMHKKQNLLDLVSRHKGSGFNIACLKMS